MDEPTTLEELEEAQRLQERTDYMLGQALRVAREYKARLERCEALAREGEMRSIPDGQCQCNACCAARTKGEKPLYSRQEALDRLREAEARCNEYVTQNMRQAQRLEQCEADIARLDWLESVLPNGDVFFTPYGAECPRIVWRDSGTHRHENYGDTVRAFLDAARAALEGK